MNQHRKTGPVPADEARALRECAAILAPLHTPEERRQIALSVELAIQGQGPELQAFRFFQIAALFYPGDAERAKNLETKLQEAVTAGDLVTVIPHDQRGLLLSELAAWPDCPAVPSNSPILYWLPRSLGADAKDLSERDGYSTPCNHLKRRALVMALKHEWPDIDKHLAEASRNGLKDAAHTGKHGMWGLEEVRAWGKRMGYVAQPATANPLQAAWMGQAHIHRIED